MGDFKMGSKTVLSQSGTNDPTWGANAPPGMVLEQFLLPCSAQAITVQSGTYTSQNVTTTQVTRHDDWDDVTGSSITYTPPSGAQLVIYKFVLQIGISNTHIIPGFRFMLGGTEANKFRTNIEGEYHNGREVFEFPLLIGGSADATIGRQATWTTGVVLKMQVKSDENNDATLHQMDAYDDSGTDQFVPPIIGITSIA